jgi:hypothetical protein
MKALISPNEPRETGYRVAQVEDDNLQFDVADPLFWVTCSNEILADQFWYDPSDETIKTFPQPEPLTEPV